MTYYYLEGRFMTDRQSAYEYIARQLDFPDYFGKNLDALADCLSEMSFNNTIIISESDKIIDNLGMYGKSIIDVFEEQSQEPYCFKLIVR